MVTAMDAETLYRDGRLREAIEALAGLVRADPEDRRRRTFLFELLCFAGDYGEAERQLELLAGNGATARLWARRFGGALRAERTRQRLFAGGRRWLPGGPA